MSDVAIKTVICKGTPRMIGVQHGLQAQAEILGTKTFYETLFQSYNLSWQAARNMAREFIPFLDMELNHYLQEMEGIAAGCGLQLIDILTLNVRSEICNYYAPDGCTSVFFRDINMSYLAQNWDWQSEQRNNLIYLRISQAPKPAIDMITEAGIIGKVGLNSSGIGVCLNALSLEGMIPHKVPVHLALRMCLDSEVLADAIDDLEILGVASACHITIADSERGVSMECTPQDIIVTQGLDRGSMAHTNHFVEHNGKAFHSVFGPKQWPDSKRRMMRANEMLGEIQPYKPRLYGFMAKKPVREMIEELLEDIDGYPSSINRDSAEGSTVETLFSIVMDLDYKVARVRFGRPGRGAKGKAKGPFLVLAPPIIERAREFGGQ